MCNIINGIYDNYDYYRSKAAAILGNDYLLLDDIISHCIIKVNNLIQEGNTKVIYKDRIDHYYFCNMIVNRARDEYKMLNAKKQPTLIPIDDNTLTIPEDNQEKIDYCASYDNVINFVNEKQKVNISALAHVLTFKYSLVDGVSINELSKRTDINRSRLTNSKKEVLSWLKEEEKRLLVKSL
jgi:hypothetical protein